jgi:hypothetical protein
LAAFATWPPAQAVQVVLVCEVEAWIVLAPHSPHVVPLRFCPAPHTLVHVPLTSVKPVLHAQADESVDPAGLLEFARQLVQVPLFI